MTAQGRLSPLSETGELVDVVMAHPREMWENPARIEREWRALNFLDEPDLSRAIDEYEVFVDLIRSQGARVRLLAGDGTLSLDAIYTRDASIATPFGMVLCRMGKAARAGEPGAHARAFEAGGVPVLGTIEPPGTLEGGDLFWLDDTTVFVGRGYRTNGEGIAQLRALLPVSVDCITVPLVHWRGPSDVFHLMSFVSPVDRGLAVVYAPLMPIPFRQQLLAAGVDFVEVPDEEFASMGANVLALAPRRCVMLDGNPITRRRLETAGVDVHVYAGNEISVKGGGGPTCLTRPIKRRGS